ncbi:MAG: hypothetical protein ACI4QT_02270 [Kiritimatiellia bacterium]
MKIFLYLLCLVAFVFIEKAVRFFLAGGTLTQPARNATFLYEQIKIVYPKMRATTVRYLALFLNSNSARSELPKRLLQEMVLEYAEREWKDLCLAYTWEWAKRVGRVDTERLPSELVLSKSNKIREQIEDASWQTAHGDRRYERKLRSIPQFVLLSIIADVEMNIKFEK